MGERSDEGRRIKRYHGNGWGVDVPVVPHEIHYSSIPKHECTILFKVPMYVHIPYSGKFSRDKIFVGGSKNENSQIKFSRMLARVRTARMPDSWIKFSRMSGQLQNPRKFCPVKISRYTVRRHVHLKCIVCKDAVGQTQEKRNLGHNSSGALVCMGKINSIQNSGIQKRCITIHLCNTQAMK